VRAITKVFEEDWARTDAGRKQARKREEAEQSDKSDKHAAAAAGA
jgi:hypothetical protein